MSKRKFRNQFTKYCLSGIKVDDTPCDKYDPLPVLTPREAILRFMAGGQIRENELRKTYYGEQYDCSDNLDYVDELHDYQEQQKAYYQHLQQTYNKQVVSNDKQENSDNQEKTKDGKEGE